MLKSVPENEINWNHLFTEVFDSSSAAETFSNPSPHDSVKEIENMLFKDDNLDFEPNQQSLDDFFSFILVDSSCSSKLLADLPVDSSGFGDAAATDKNPNVSDESEEVYTNNEDNKNDNIDNDESYNNNDDDPVSKK
ncbi:hypothetical protein Dsin_026953 [Dipteronia sinensis]|uniref:Uncharacterized protein n=1 Tax=Dipteronia sinensis TaxID=43782 RepID=A0AAE0A070_9ROSI|nr:hypothetical protein Dsin_026953 [Dipteronia sinensis]